MNREVKKIEYLPEGDGKVKLFWENRDTDLKYEDATYDYAVVAVPFSIVRRWRLPRKYGCNYILSVSHISSFHLRFLSNPCKCHSPCSV